MQAAQGERTPGFLQGLAEEGFLERFLGSRLGATTHISVLDGNCCACSVTCTNGEGSGVVVPGTGMHVNNVMGEEDLNPEGFHRHPPGRRMPSMMAPLVVLRGGEVELVLGSAGSSRIRSALLQTIRLRRRPRPAGRRGDPRAHLEDGIVYHEPGVPVQELGERVSPATGAQTRRARRTSWSASTPSTSSSAASRASRAPPAHSSEQATRGGTGWRWTREGRR